LASTWQLQLSHWAVRASYDAAQPDDQRRSGLERPFQMSELFCVRKMRRSHRGGTRPSLVQSVYTRPCTTLARPEARPPYSRVFSRRNPPPPPRPPGQTLQPPFAAPLICPVVSVCAPVSVGEGLGEKLVEEPAEAEVSGHQPHEVRPQLLRRQWHQLKVLGEAGQAARGETGDGEGGATCLG
jgi:hypothetical protein